MAYYYAQPAGHTAYNVDAHLHNTANKNTAFSEHAWNAVKQDACALHVPATPAFMTTATGRRLPSWPPAVHHRAAVEYPRLASGHQQQIVGHEIPGLAFGAPFRQPLPPQPSTTSADALPLAQQVAAQIARSYDGMRIT